MSHSKRNTSLAFFTSHERSLLRSTWGSQSTRLNRDSFLSFGSCNLCLLPAQDPVACSGGPQPSPSTEPEDDKKSGNNNNNSTLGKRKRATREQCHIFCRECIVANLLAQRKELKRLESLNTTQVAEQEEAEKFADEEARARAVVEFERVQAGLESKYGGVGKSRIVGRGDGKVMVEEVVVDATAPERSGKRKFELDEAELMRIAEDDRAKARKVLDEEKLESSKPSLPSFWLPSTTTPTSHLPSSTSTTKKSSPICPGSTPSTPHPISLKSLVTINFTSEPTATSKAAEQTETEVMANRKTRSCPSCSRSLTNASKAVLASPCGHVICGSCADKFMSGDDDDGTARCFVCSADVSGGGGKQGKKDKGKEKILGKLMEISCEGTGFAGGGKNVVKREGVAFQC